MKNSRPVFSVITPSYNMLKFLPMCCASVADQQVSYEHIVVDAASTDGTIAWLQSRRDIASIIEKDDGMYDAINKGIRNSSGEIISYLNCDEQYLPETLQRVGRFFQQNPKVDLLFGNTLFIKPNGELLSFRKGFKPRWAYIWASEMYITTSSMFVRRRVFDSVMFDPAWRTVGDADFVIRALRGGFTAAHLPEYFSAFIFTDSNLGHSETARAELNAFRATAPWWLRRANILTKPLIRIEKLLNRCYSQSIPLAYSVYTPQSLQQRVTFTARNLSPFYPQPAG